MISSEVKAKVQELLTQGWTQSQIAEHLGVPAHRITYLARVLGAPRRTRGQPRKDGVAVVRRKPAPKPPIPLAPPLDPVDDPPATDATAATDATDATDALGLVRSLMADARRDYTRAAKSYDAGNATKFARIAAQLTPVLARLEKATAEEGDVIRLPRDQIEAKRKELRDKMRQLCADLPRCADCGRALRVSWGEHD